MKDLTIEELEVLLCSTGYLPPRNEEELSFFNDMYEDYTSHIENRHVDINIVLNETCQVVTDYRYIDASHVSSQAKVAEDNRQYSMAARNFDKLPKDVLEKMKKQHKRKHGDED